jgi:hypothetical protein
MQVAYIYDAPPRCSYKFNGKERDSESGLDNFGRLACPLPGAILAGAAPVFAVFEGRGFSAAGSQGSSVTDRTRVAD